MHHKGLGELDARDLVRLDAGHYCHCEAQQPLAALIADAARHGFEIAIVSGYRDFERQAAIFEQKFTGSRPVLDAAERPVDIRSFDDAQKIAAICVFSAIPGFSRHHLGSDFDIYPANLLPHTRQLQLTAREYDQHSCDGYFYPFLNYLRERLSLFGFCMPYTGTNGVGFEPWHISYKQLADRMLAGFSPEAGYERLRRSTLACRYAAIAYAQQHYRQLLALDV